MTQWPGGFQGEVTVRNPGTSTLSGWTVPMTFANGQTVTQLWNGVVGSQSGGAATVRNENWNGVVAPNGSTTFGFLGSWSGTNAPPSLSCTSP